jgi:cytidine deaminase
VSRELYERAVAISERAYAPYSNYFVGAAVRTRDGKVFEGVNVETPHIRSASVPKAAYQSGQ